jgi:hypothetical protein
MVGGGGTVVFPLRFVHRERSKMERRGGRWRREGGRRARVSRSVWDAEIKGEGRWWRGGS